jgi:hypothetical protein
MTEPEILLTVKCPICMQQSVTGFRISVVADALETGDIRLYADCHVASWDASEAELEQIREFLDATWSEDLREACQAFTLETCQDDDNVAFIYTGALDDLETGDAILEGSFSR